MKSLFCVIAAVLMAALLASCSFEPPEPYTITGELVVVENNEPQEVAPDGSSNDEPEMRLDPTSVSVTVSYETTRWNGDVKTVELASGDFSEGTLELTGVVDEPTTVEIAVDIGEDEPLTASAVLSPGGKTRFAVLDYLGSYPTDELAMMGSSRLTKDAKKKFSIAGDFSSVDEDLSHAVLTASALQYDDEGKVKGLSLGAVLLENDTFLIEGNIDEPARVQVFLSAPGNSYYASTQDILVEPGSEITVYARGRAPDLLATSGVGMHAALIESWQQTEEYLSTFDKYAEAYAQFMADWEDQRQAAQSGTEENQDTDDKAASDEQIASDSTESDDSTETEITLAEEADEDSATDGEDSVAIVLEDPPKPAAEGCEHAVLAASPSANFRTSSSIGLPEYYKLRQQLDGIQQAALQAIATQSESPIKSLLAMELGAFGAENRSDALPVYDRLVTLFDEDRYVKRINQARDRVVWFIESEENDESLIPGQKAPEFTLANLEGTEVALYDVLAEKELVLIDFWASWCGPCIADFPELKRLYSAYNNLGFEIVGVSIDSAFEDWEGGSTEHELPWIDLGEMDGWEGATATSYGVLAIPKGFLLDSKGCILEKRVRPAQLEEALVARFGEVPELTDPSTESESEIEDPSSDEMGG